ncbi:MAG: hypothetical protein WBA65_09365 [Rhodanobacter sp.]
MTSRRSPRARRSCVGWSHGLPDYDGARAFRQSQGSSKPPTACEVKLAHQNSPLRPRGTSGHPEAQAEYISAALETGDPAFIADSLGVVTRARGMSQLARDTGLRCESLY